MREAAGVIPLALEVVQPQELWNVGVGEAAHGRNQVTSRDVLAVIGVRCPNVVLLVKFCADDDSVKVLSCSSHLFLQSISDNIWMQK